MATTIVTKNGTGAPTDSDLVAGELAVDLTNGRLYTTDLDSGGTVLELGTNPASDVTFGDNTKAIFGAGSDLQIFHDASDSYIKDEGTGNLYLTTNGSTMNLQAGSDNMVKIYKDAQVEIFHDASVKLATTATGIDVTGTVTADGLTISAPSGDTPASIVTTTAGSFLSIADGNTTSGRSPLVGAITDDIVFYTSAGSYNERMRIDSGGSVLIGKSTPTDLHNTWNHLIIGEKGAIISENGAGGIDGITLADNVYIDADTGSYAYQTTAAASQITQSGGVIAFSNAASGSAGAALTPVERMRIDSSGRLLINKTSSTGSLSLESQAPTGFSVGSGFYSDATQSTIEFQDTNTTANYKVRIGSETDDLLMFAGGSERMRIANTGQLLVGSGTSPASGEVKQTLARAGSSYLEFQNTSANTGSTIGTSGENFIVYTNSGALGSEAYTERMRIDASGNLFVGTTVSGVGTARQIVYNDTSNIASILVNQSGTSNGTPVQRLYHYEANSTTSATMIQFLNRGVTQVGSITSTGSVTAYNTSSDQRLKDNIVDAPSASDDIDAIQVRSFDWKVDGSHQKYGMVAQELQTVAPEAVSGDADSEEMMGVDYSKLVPMLVKEIQSLRARVAQLES